MSSVSIGYVGLAVSMVLLFLRVPIGIALGLVSFLGIASLLNLNAAWGIITAVPFNFVGDWNLTAVPMFLLMGFIASEAGLTQGLFRTMRILLSWLPGGLAVASVGACAGLSAASGSSVATASAFARIATPEMLRYRYDPGLASGVIASGGTLGSLIPPSILMILYGYIAEVSVRKLFAAGVFPGLLTAAAFTLMIILRTWLNPSLAPPVNDRFSWAELREALLDTWSLPVIIVGVLSGIFLGVFTPTEAGAVGAALAILVAALKRALTLQVLSAGIRQTLVGSATLFMVIIGTSLLARFMALSGVPTAIAETFLEWGQSPLMIILIVALIYLVLGCFIDSIGILLLTMPIILPMAREVGLDLIWFGVLLVKLLEIGLLTPPVGLNIYVVKSALGNRVSLNTIFRGVSWFIAVDVLILIVLVFVPALSLWLPGQLE